MFAPFSRCVRSVLLLAAAWGASVSFAAAIQPANPAAPPPAGVLIDPGWPRTYQTQTGTVVCFQPQIDEWKDGRVAGRMAVGAQLAGAGEPVFGALWFTGSTVADQKLRVAQIYDIAVARTSFPPGAPNVAAIDQAVRSVVPSNVRHLDLDRLLANLARTKRARRSGAAKLSNSTPKIVVVHQPGVLVPLFGDPVLQTIPAAGLQAVINTPADLLLDPKSGRVYLATADAWLVSNDLLAGPWDWATAPPPGLDQIPANDPRSAAKQVGVHAGTDKAPLVVVSTKPTELIALDGEPVLVPLENTKLMFAANTPNDVFVSTVDRKWYVLLSGRWFTSASLDDGPWLHVPSTQLPADFSQIPPTSPKANVLPSVAGTLAAQEALLADTIPQFAAVARESAQLKVTYDGPPNFAAIPRTNLTYATNTAFDVIGADGAFYCCYQAVWFTAVDPLGPWTLADAVPEEIYEIPASHPLFHDTFVEVYDSSPAEIVYGYLPGYLGSYPDNGVIVYGTGYNHSPYLNRDRGVFFGWPVTWGGAWRYNPFFNGFGYRAGWYTPYQHGFVRAGWNPTAGWAGATLERYTPYGHWGESVVRHGESWVRTAGAPARVNTAGAQPGNQPGPAPAGPNNVYVGDDGNVYRRGDDGAWNRYLAEGWSPVLSPLPKSALVPLGLGVPGFPGPADPYAARSVVSALNSDFGARMIDDDQTPGWRGVRADPLALDAYRPGGALDGFRGLGGPGIGVGPAIPAYRPSGLPDAGAGFNRRGGFAGSAGLRR